ncbi:MAG: glycosyltransferase involved in cell wall biosynthesis [Glaciecola sp.]
MMPQRLAIFGAYSDHDLYQRNRILVNILEELSGETVYVRPETRSAGHGFSSGKTIFSRVGGLLRDAWSLWSQRSLLRGCDTVFVPYPAYLDIALLWISGQTRRKRLIVDAFLELHSTVVEDRKLIPHKSLRARMLLAFQRFTLGKADVVLIDTAEQATLLRQYLAGTDTQVAEIPVGIDESIWTEIPRQAMAERARLLFWGTFIPLHGVEHIVAAARLLESQGVDVDLRIIGDGQVAPSIWADLERAPLNTLSWERRIVDTDTLRGAIAEAHIVLGAFGDSLKAASVVPYKVHQALASGRPTITRSGAAINALADEHTGLIVCPPADPAALAGAIEETIARLKSDWSPAPRTVYEQHFSNRVIKESLIAALDPRLNPECTDR